MNTVRMDAAAELQVAIAHLKLRAEIEGYSMLAYLLGIAEEEARGIASGEGFAIEETNVVELKIPDLTGFASVSADGWRRFIRMFRDF